MHAYVLAHEIKEHSDLSPIITVIKGDLEWIHPIKFNMDIELVKCGAYMRWSIMQAF